jgi:hypothetical protein
MLDVFGQPAAGIDPGAGFHLPAHSLTSLYSARHGAYAR